MAKRSIDDWRGSLDYLPDCLKDFHDQKDLFKAMHDTVRIENHEYAKTVSWTVGQCYVIDIFLWWMARHGYKLQRSSANVSFDDLDTLISKLNDQWIKQSGLGLSPLTSQEGE